VGRSDGLFSAPTLLTASGLLFWNDVVEPFEHGDAFGWVALLRERKEIKVPESDADELAARLYSGEAMPALRVPERLKMEEVRPAAQFHLKITAPNSKYAYDARLLGRLTIEYQGQRVDGATGGRAIVDRERRQVVLRDLQAEAQAHARLYRLGFRITGITTVENGCWG